MSVGWHYKVRGEEVGPVTFAQLVDAVCAKTIDENSPVRGAWQSEWLPATKVIGLFRAARMENERRARERHGSKPANTPVVTLESGAPAARRINAPAAPAARKKPSPLDDAEDGHGNRFTPAGSWLSKKLTPRSLIAIIAAISLAAVISVGILYWQRESSRFPAPAALWARAQTGHYVFGWGPLATDEYVLVCFDACAVIVGATLFGIRRFLRIRRKQ